MRADRTDEEKERSLEEHISVAQQVYWILIIVGALPAIFIMGAVGQASDYESSIIFKIEDWFLALSYPIFILMVFISGYFAKDYLRMGDYKKSRRLIKYPFFWIIISICLYLFLVLASKIK